MRKKKNYCLFYIYIIVNFYDFRFNNVLVSFYLFYRIGGDLYFVVNLGYDKDIEVMIRVIKIYVMVLVVFDYLIYKNCELFRNFFKKILYLVDFSDKRKSIFFWFSGFRFYDVEKILKVSGFFFVIFLYIYVFNIMY